MSFGIDDDWPGYSATTPEGWYPVLTACGKTDFFEISGGGRAVGICERGGGRAATSSEIPSVEVVPLLEGGLFECCPSLEKIFFTFLRNAIVEC